jgi:hypothetical protein
MSGIVDYLSNAFGPERAAAWDAAIAAQGLTLKVKRAADDSFTDDPLFGLRLLRRRRPLRGGR